MGNMLLQSLRDHMLDESEPLAGLLRKCLLLGAETGSDSLREWARRELNGYEEGEEEAEAVPEYRKIYNVPISMDSMSGNTWMKGQIISRLQLPEASRQFVPEAMEFRQPVEELERLSGQKSLSFGSPGLAAAQTIWNSKLGPYQNIVGMSFVVPASTFVGIVGQVRTKLVDIVADLTAETPLTELPKKERVDAAVSQRVGRDVYNTTIHEAKGPTAIGPHAKATAEGLSVEDVIALLAELRRQAGDLDEGDDRQELEEAITELREAVEGDHPETGDVIKKVGKLREIADRLGLAAISTATGTVVGTLTDMAVNGAFH